MIREIVIPKDNKHVLHLPDGYVGKTVEVIAFEIGEKEEVSVAKPSASDAARAFFESIQVDMSGFRFNRDDANER